MTSLIGIALVLLLLGLYAVLVRQLWRAPFRALGVLVAGMAVHNFLLMVLLRLHTPGILVRLVQAWKEGILLLLGLLVLAGARRAWRARRLPRLFWIDYVVLASAALAMVYFVLPPSVLHNAANLSQRIIGVRIVLLLPLLYLYGRVFQPAGPRDLQWVAWVIVGTGAAVGLFGLFELWLVPTRVWIGWGVNLLSNWLGFSYPGPQGLPPNFFQTTADGLLLRRMVSTYVSPLGIAYAGLGIAPLAMVLVLQRQALRARGWLAWAAAILFATGILFSLTRLALALLVFELLLLSGLFPRVRLLLSTAAVAAGVVAMLFVYPQVGPLVDRHLQPPLVHPTHVTITGASDASLKEHSGLLAFDLQYVLQHPLGTGLGSSIHRLGASQGTGESAVFDMFGDLGFLGGALYLVMYAGAIVFGLLALMRLRRDRLLSSLPLVAVVGGLGLFLITLTSDVWGDFATTFLFWWAAGSSVAILAGRRVEDVYS
jgi:hypothetical protein